jgi:hypothetical protein
VVLPLAGLASVLKERLSSPVEMALAHWMLLRWGIREFLKTALILRMFPS